jgi:hypothetical protein
MPRHFTQLLHRLRAAAATGDDVGSGHTALREGARRRCHHDPVAQRAAGQIEWLEQGVVRHAS